MVLPLLLAMASSLAIAGKAQLSARHHVVDVVIPQTMSLPENFPVKSDLLDGIPSADNKKLTCFTCHDDERLKDGRPTAESFSIETPSTEAGQLLREGPYEALTDFCYRCHDRKQNQRPNLHIMLDAQGDIIETQCTYCHDGLPDIEALHKLQASPAEKPKLRLPAEKLCYGCHLKTPHLNAGPHQVKANEKMQQRIRDYSNSENIAIPLGESGEILCITCHSPHQKGVLDTQHPAGKQAGMGNLKRGVQYSSHAWNEVYVQDKKRRLARFSEEHGWIPPLQYQRLEHEELIRLPAKDGSLCLVCHQFEF